MFALHPAQAQIAADRHRFRVVNAGRRFGKSTLVAWEMFAIAVSQDNARVPYYAPTRDDARDIIWKTLKEICAPVTIGEPNESRLEINIRNRFGGTSLLVLYGWEAVQERGKGVGVKNNHIFLDEVSKFKNFKFGWDEILRPTLMDLQGGATFISTPNGFNHFYELSLKPNKDSDWVYFHFTSWDNPHMTSQEIEKMRLEMGEDRYAQEVMGEFRKREGLVYKEFNRDKHVLSKLPDVPFLTTVGGIDWGHTHPAAVLTIKKDYEGNYYICDELFKPGLTEEDVVDYVVSANFNKAFPDPENASGIESLRRRGVNVKTVNKRKGSVVSGISKIQELLRQNKIFVIGPKCPNTIYQFESYSYPEDEGKLPNENPLKENDDAMDAMRYAIVTDVSLGSAGGPKAHYGIGRSYGTRVDFSKFR